MCFRTNNFFFFLSQLNAKLLGGGWDGWQVSWVACVARFRAFVSSKQRCGFWLNLYVTE